MVIFIIKYDSQNVKIVEIYIKYVAMPGILTFS